MRQLNAKMIKKYFLILLLIPFAYAEIVSDVYETEAYLSALAGENPVNTVYDSRYTLSYQQAFGSYAENAIYSLTPGWPYIIDIYPAAAVTPPVTGGEGGRISAAAECDYDWKCTSWFPMACPIDGIQERMCVNYGTCTGTLGMPDLTRVCYYEGPFEPLFDIFLTISSEYKEVAPGDYVRADVKLENFGKLELLDAFMTYWILDQNNKLIVEAKDSRSVTDELVYGIELLVPVDTIQGTYKLYAQINYDDNKTALAGESFKVALKPAERIPFDYSKYIMPFVLAFALLIILILIILLAKKKKKDDDEDISGLVDYLKNALAAGHTLENIKDYLIKYGYKEKDIEKAIEKIRKP